MATWHCTQAGVEVAEAYCILAARHIAGAGGRVLIYSSVDATGGRRARFAWLRASTRCSLNFLWLLTALATFLTRTFLKCRFVYVRIQFYSIEYTVLVPARPGGGMGPLAVLSARSPLYVLRQ